MCMAQGLMPAKTVVSHDTEVIAKLELPLLFLLIYNIYILNKIYHIHGFRVLFCLFLFLNP